MGWETRKRGRLYYTRSRREGGRVVREYLGCGGAARQQAYDDEEERQGKRPDAATKQARAEDKAMALEVETLCQRVRDVMADSLIAAGYHLHARSQWRKRRDAHGRDVTPGETAEATPRSPQP